MNMANASNPDRAQIVSEFETMKSFELSARDLYTQIANDPRVDQEKIRNAFAKLAEDEHRHAGLVQEILRLLDAAHP